MAASFATRALQGLTTKLLVTRHATRILHPRSVARTSFQTRYFRTSSTIWSKEEEDKLEVKKKHIAALDSNFEEDPEKASGKTTVNILNHESEEGIFFDAYSSMGFKLSNGMRIVGPCAVFPRSVLHWNVKNIREITPASLKLFTILEPKIDILIVGVGERENLKHFDPAIIRFLRENRVNVEILATDQALSTFNFLNSEKRYVAAALLPPTYDEDESFDTDAIISSRLGLGEDIFLTQHDYDYIPEGHEPGITDEKWESRYETTRESFKSAMGTKRLEKGEEDMYEPPPTPPSSADRKDQDYVSPTSSKEKASEDYAPPTPPRKEG